MHKRLQYNTEQPKSVSFVSVEFDLRASLNAEAPDAPILIVPTSNGVNLAKFHLTDHKQHSL